MNVVAKALASARAARFTHELRERVSVAMDAPEGLREPLLIAALESAVEALDALAESLRAAGEGDT